MQTGPKVGIGIATIRRSRRMVQASEPLLLVVALLSVAILGGCTGIVSASKPNGSTTGAFQLTPATLNFGNVAVGKQSSQTVTLSNTGTTSVTIMQATVSNPQFTVSGVNLPMTVASGQSGNFTIGVKPTVTGTLNGTLTVQGDSSSGSGTVNLAATVTAANPQISLSSNSINFGSVTVGSSGSSSLTISNTGGSDLTISSASLTGTGFGISGITTPKVISAGQSSVVSLTFSPAATGAASGSLAISSSDPTNPTLHVNLSGTGTTAPTGTLQPNQTSLSFGNVSTGSNLVKQVVVTNTGTSSVQITGVGVTGAGFTVSGVTPPTTVNASGQVTLSVTFAPTTAGNASGTVSVNSNASGSPTTISLSGNGVVAASHTVGLSWTASPTSTVIGYNVYRSTTSGTGYVKVNPTLVPGASYTDSAVLNSTTYYYVTTAVDSIGDESVYSNEATAVVP
jgi:hypothetical protein